MAQFMVVFYGHYLKKCQDFQYRRYFKSITFESTSSLKITFTRFAERQIFRILAFDFTALFTILRATLYNIEPCFPKKKGARFLTKLGNLVQEEIQVFEN